MLLLFFLFKCEPQVNRTGSVFGQVGLSWSKFAEFKLTAFQYEIVNDTTSYIVAKARFKRRTCTESNANERRQLIFFSFALDSARVKFDV